jgi:hypothetical protein
VLQTEQVLTPTITIYDFGVPNFGHNCSYGPPWGEISTWRCKRCQAWRHGYSARPIQLPFLYSKATFPTNAIIIRRGHPHALSAFPDLAALAHRLQHEYHDSWYGFCASNARRGKSSSPMRLGLVRYLYTGRMTSPTSILHVRSVLQYIFLHRSQYRNIP